MLNEYSRLGDYIEQTNCRNDDLKVKLLLGISIEKKFIPSHANVVGTDFKNYKIVHKGEFAYGPVTSRNGDKVSIAMLQDAEECLISSSYTSFRIKNTKELNPDYLLLLFSNPEFDRYARYNSWGSARETFSWEDLCDTILYIPKIEKQNEIVMKIQMISERVNLLQETNGKIFEIMQAELYHKIFKETSISDLTDISQIDLPDKWQIKYLKEIADCQSGYAFYKDGYCKKGVRVLDLGNININSEFIKMKKDKRVDPSHYSNCKFDKYRLKKNDLVMVMTDRKSTMELLGKTGKVLDNENMLLNQRVYRIRSKIDTDYLYSYLNSDIVSYYHKSVASGTAQKYVNNGDIDNIPIILPDDKTFKDISNKFNNYMKLFEINVKEIEKLEELNELYRFVF